MRPLLSPGASNFDAGARDRGVEERVLLGKFAKLVRGARDVSDAGGVSSLLPGSDFTGVLEKWSKLDRTSVCCNKRCILDLVRMVVESKDRRISNFWVDYRKMNFRLILRYSVTNELDWKHTFRILKLMAEGMTILLETIFKHFHWYENIKRL